MKHNLLGKRFGRLVVLGKAPSAGSQPKVYWSCRCDCGVLKTIRSQHLYEGKIHSCGCLAIDELTKRSVSHGHSRGGECSAEYQSWQRAKNRCTNPNSPDWPRYGGRGIAMHPRWLNSFDAFYKDMGKRPEGTSLERKDNEKDYSPNNCIWGTKLQQANNTRANVYLNYQGRSYTLAQLARKLNLNYRRLRYAYVVSGLSVEDSIKRGMPR